MDDLREAADALAMAVHDYLNGRATDAWLRLRLEDLRAALAQPEEGWESEFLTSFSCAEEWGRLFRALSEETPGYEWRIQRRPLTPGPKDDQEAQTRRSP